MSKKKNNNKQDLIDQLIKERKLRKLTQEELAQIVGCPQPSISRIENRISSPTLEMIEKICDALSIDIFTKRRF